MRSIEPQVRNCGPGNVEIPGGAIGLVLRTIPE